MIPTDLLPALSARFAAAVLTDFVDIYRPAPISDGAGGQTPSWRRVAASVPCEFTYDDGGQDEGNRQQVATTRDWFCALPVGTDVLESDQLRRADGVAYDVVSTNAGRSQALTLTVRCREPQ